MKDDKKKKQNSVKKTTNSKRKIDIPKPKPKEEKPKIPKGVDRTWLTKEGNIIMMESFRDLSDKPVKPASKKEAPKKSISNKKPEKAKTTSTKKPPAKKVTETKSKVNKEAPKLKQKDTKKAKAELKPLKPDWDFEKSTGGDKPIIIKGKATESKPKRASRRELKRVAKVGGYTVFDGARAGKTFATPEEAKNYALDVFMRTGEMVPVSRTDRQISHTFKAENKTGK